MTNTKLLECFLQGFFDVLRHEAIVAMGAPDSRLIDDAVNQSEDFSRGAVIPIVSAASPARSTLFQRMDAHPFGEITE